MWAVVTIRHSDPAEFCFEDRDLCAGTCSFACANYAYDFLGSSNSGWYPGVGLDCSSGIPSEPVDTNRKLWVGAPAEADALCQVFLGPEEWLLCDVPIKSRWLTDQYRVHLQYEQMENP